jgi:hypothetical protein
MMNAYETQNETKRLISASREIIARIQAIIGRVVRDRAGDQETPKPVTLGPHPERSSY